MGKRQRRRERESTATKPRRQKLGASVYMVCAVCNEPLNTYSRVNPDDEFDEEIIRWIHSLEYLDDDGQTVATGREYDHPAIPVEGTPISADVTCDFCHAPSPVYVFVPRRPIRVMNHLTFTENDYSSPWSCCKGCMPAVKSRDIKRIINRVIASDASILSLVPSEDLPIFRTQLRLLYAEYLKSDPAGPYEVRIQPPHKPVGKRGSLRGM